MWMMIHLPSSYHWRQKPASLLLASLGPSRRPSQPTQSKAQSGAQSIRVLSALSRSALSARTLADALGMRSKTDALKRTLSEMLSETLIECVLPDRPNSRLQKYRLTDKGRQALDIKPEEHERADHG